MKGVGWIVKGVGSSNSPIAASHASFEPGSSSDSIIGELATRAETQEYHLRLDAMENSM